MYYIFTDGSSARNGQSNQVGGWGYVILDDKENIICSKYGGKKGTTNNWGELTAAVEAVKYIKKNLMNKSGFIRELEYIIYTDSAYLINCANQGWYLKWMANGWMTSQKTPVANKELWEELIPTFDNTQFEYRKVRGHQKEDSFTSKWNNYADSLAVIGRRNAENG